MHAPLNREREHNLERTSDERKPPFSDYLRLHLLCSAQGHAQGSPTKHYLAKSALASGRTTQQWSAELLSRKIIKTFFWF